MKSVMRQISLLSCFLTLAAAILTLPVPFVDFEKADASLMSCAENGRLVNTDNTTHKIRPGKSGHFSGLSAIKTGDFSEADLPGMDPVLLERKNTKFSKPALSAGTLAVVYVNASTGDDSYDGSSPSVLPGGVGPKKTIQAGVFAADYYSVVYVAEGVYRENVFITDCYMDLIGAGARKTIIDGGGSGSVLFIDGCDIWIEGFTIQNGYGTVAGGAADIGYSDVYFEYCTIKDNYALVGGGVSSLYSWTTLYESTVASNSAHHYGGGIANINGILTVVNSTISGNTVRGSHWGGGGIYSNSSGYWLTGIELFGSTLANNSAPASAGGGFYNNNYAVSYFESCIVANNTAATPGTNNAFTSGRSYSDGYNIDSENTCDFNDATDQVNTDPKLGPLKDNGGPTDTHAITAASPAFERGYSGDHLDWYAFRDQRGVARPQGVYCDVGAYELEMKRQASIKAANWGGLIKLSTSAGGIVDLSSSGRCPGGGSWSGAIFPYGLFSFKIVGISAGSTVKVTITFPGLIPSDFRYMQCDGRGQWTDITSLVSRGNGDNILVLTLKDGGTGDLDHTANGRIVDPAGPCLLPFQGPRSSATIMAPQQPVALPSLSVQNVTLSSSKTTPGNPITVEADITNTGTVSGDMIVKLYVNGQEEDSRSVTVGSGYYMPVTFTVSRNEPGTYSVYVGSVNAGEFTVDSFTDPAMILIISSSMLFAALVLAMVYVYRRRAL